MGSLITGGGSGAVASSAHAGCPRFRATDPLLVGRTRRSLAATLGSPDTGAGIPAARWVRAMAFERLVHDRAFVSELLTRAVGLLELDRPEAVRVRAAGDSVENTAKELAAAHLKARHAGEATMLFGLRIPFVALEETRATDVRPDFAIVAPRVDGGRAAGSWLVVGDAKDYERVRSRIDDGRLLKGFLQVALGAESVAAWGLLPRGMHVHRYGALAVPRNAYLRPEAVVEDLADHRSEVRARVEERLAAREDMRLVDASDDELRKHVRHVAAVFDPATCPSCSLFSYCRGRLRGSEEPADLMVEIGVPAPHRGAVLGIVDGTGTAPPPRTPQSMVQQVEATATGLPQRSERLRVDAVGLPGTVHVVVVKSDAASLGIHGIAVQRVDGSGSEPWQRLVFERTNATETRHAVMAMLGREVGRVLELGQGPVHLVVPDRSTADLLVSAADSLAGVELSRLRWQRDLDEGREILTFDGEPATMPAPLDEDARTAVSLLLEEDRARAFGLRQPVIDLRRVLADHVVPGGPASDAGRLDYLVAWAEAAQPLDHRAVSDSIADQWHTPGARLSNVASDAIHEAGRPGRGDPDAYARMVGDALDYRIDVLSRAVGDLEAVPRSRLREAYRALEHDAQTVWRRRLALRASDLVRFSRTYRYWRNAQVDMLDADRACRDRLTALLDGRVARDRAVDAGVRDLAIAVVTDVGPLRLEVRSRHLVDGARVVLLHTPHGPVAEDPSVTLAVQAGSFKLGQVPIGGLTADEDSAALRWDPGVTPSLAVGDEVVIAGADWLGANFRSGHELAVARPGVDSRAAPRTGCEPTSYSSDPVGHQWCCRPHVAAEAEWSDEIADRRAKGQLNPQVWPPVVDQDRFDLDESTDPTDTTEPGPVPEGLTIDDLE